MLNMEATTPVVVLGVQVGGLAAARSLGRLGVPVYGVNATKASPGMLSRYWTKTFLWDVVRRSREDSRAFMRTLAEEIGRRAILLPTVDSTAALVAEHADELTEWFDFARVDPRMLRSLMNKVELCAVANAHGVPTAQVTVPRTRDDVASFSENVAFPIVIKGIDPTRKYGKMKAVVHSRDALLEAYDRASDVDPPNLMLQEYIPGDDTTGWTFYGYFNGASECVAGYSARKIRLSPAHTGLITLGFVDQIPAVQGFCARFMTAVGYRGPVNIGGKFDHRDGKYKVLDVNARLGASFRLCVSESGMDVVQMLYRDLTGQALPREPAQLGRRWLYEEDVFEAPTYMRSGELTFGAWLRSLRGIDECAMWARDDIRPFGYWLLSRLKGQLTGR
jgi:predicted ATP-grasp superfamily ATP-dependent carboligase